MTTLTVQIPEQNTDILQTIKDFLKPLQNISFKVEDSHMVSQKNKEQTRIIQNLQTVCTDISSGKALTSAKPLEDLYAQL